MATVEVQQIPTTTTMAPASALVAAAAAAPATKGPSKRGRPKSAKAKTPHNHPGYQHMIKVALVALNDKKGSSRAAILKHIAQNFKLGEQLQTINAHLRQALRRGVESGFLKHTKGVGASGSFLLAEGKVHKEHKKTKKHTAKKTAIAKKKPAGEKLVAKKVGNVKKHVKKATKKATGGAKKAGKKPKVAKKAARSPKMSKATKAKKPKNIAVPKPKTTA